MKALVFSTVLLTSVASGQLFSTGIPKEDREVTDRQADQVFRVLRAVAFDAKDVVYPIYSGRKQIANGISIGDDRLLVKASEVVDRRRVFTADRNGQGLSARLLGAYPEHDLAVLKVEGLNAPAAKWADASNLSEGSFLSAIRSDGEVRAMGVLSVRERSLKGNDQGFLGIQMDPAEIGEGVRIGDVVPKSAAAQVGLKAGDVISMVDGEEVRGFYELMSTLRKMKKGDQPEIGYFRGGEIFFVTPTLKGREIEDPESRRLQRMDRMSGTQSKVRGNFSNVLQSDMELEASDSGLPVVDLDGRIVGMVIARAGRISSLILPGDDIEEILKGDLTPIEPKVGRNRRAAREGGRSELARRLIERFARDLSER